MVADAKLLGQGPQALTIALAFTAPDMRMRHSGHNIDHFRMASQNRRQSPNYVFDALVWRQKSERKQYRLAFRTKLVFEVVRIHERQIRNTVRDHINLFGGNRIDIAKKLGCQFAHHHQAIG